MSLTLDTRPSNGLPRCCRIVQVMTNVGHERSQTRRSENDPASLLQPFPHQTDGHLNIFTYQGDTICKALVETEYEFYRTMPEALRPFAPICKGDIDIMFDRQANNQVRISIVSTLRPFHWQNEAVGNHTPQGPVGQQERRSTVMSTSDAEKNPWSTRFKQMLDQDQLPRRYILLENAVTNFKRPSILDLKMGVRQYPPGASEHKMNKKLARCVSTTSCTHGVRVHGMQVYQQDTGDYHKDNRFAFTAINKDTIHEPFYRFLFNGVRVRLDLIDPIVERIQEILTVVAKRNDIRLFTSSLMIVYESEEGGSDDEEDARSPHETIPGEADCAQTARNADSASPKINIKLIDFAHSRNSSMSSDFEFVGPDVGYVFGLQNVIKLFLDIKKRYAAS